MTKAAERLTPAKQWISTLSSVSSILSAQYTVPAKNVTANSYQEWNINIPRKRLIPIAVTDKQISSKTSIIFLPQRHILFKLR